MSATPTRTQRIDATHVLLSQIAGDVKDIRAKVQQIEAKLWIDNGSPCIQTRLDRHEQAIGAASWMTRTALGAAVVALIGLAVKVLST